MVFEVHKTNGKEQPVARH